MTADKPTSSVLNDPNEIRRLSEARAREESKLYGPPGESVELAFPYDIMGGFLGELASLFSRHLEPPSQFFYMAGMTCLGSILAGRLVLKSEITSEPRLYTLLLGESADDRKSTAITKVVTFFLQEAIKEFSVCYGIGSAEGLQKILARDNHLLLGIDEFKAFVAKCRIESSVLLPCVTSLFENTHYESQTQKKSVKIESASLSILAASTIDTYQCVFDENFLAIGFPNRIFLVPGKGKRKYSIPERIPPEEKLQLAEQLRKILYHIGAYREIEITAGGRKMFHNWYMGLPQSVHTKRLDSYALRLMPLLAVNELKPQIDENVVQKVISLCDWQYIVRKRYDPIDADTKSARMEEAIRRALGTGPRKERDLKRATNAHRAGLWMYETAIQNLLKAEEISKDLKMKTYCLTDLSSPLSS